MRLRKTLIVSGDGFSVKISQEEARVLGVETGDQVEVDIVPVPAGLRLDPDRFFKDGHGSVAHDQEIGDVVSRGG